MSAPDNIDQASASLGEQTQSDQNAHHVYSSDEEIPFGISLAELQAAPDPLANWRRRHPPLQLDTAPDTRIPSQRLGPEYANDQTLIKMGIPNLPVEDDTEPKQDPQPESSTAPLRRGDKPPTLILPCSICFQEKDIRDLCILPCTHHCCGQCINKLFERDLSSESLFPPRCCPSTPPIPFKDARPFLRKELVEKYVRRKVEFEAPRCERTYCHLPECRSFIDPDSILGTIATCPICTAITCAQCKNGEHPGRCQYNANTLKARASRVGRPWTTCYRCRRTIERTDGCLYIRCRCGILVCCTCSRRWDMNNRHEDEVSVLAVPVIVSDSVIEGRSEPRPLPEEGVGNDKGSDGDADDEEEDEIGELIDVYYDQREREMSPDHAAFPRELNEYNRGQGERDQQERDVFYDAPEYIEQESDESDGGVNVDPFGIPIGQPVFNADAPFDPGVEGQSEEFVNELFDEQRQQQGEEQTETEQAGEIEDESEVEQISDHDEIAERVLRGLGIDCQHLQWTEVFGLGRCESCIQDPQGRRYRCTNCGIIVCRTSREEVVRYIMFTGRLFD